MSYLSHYEYRFPEPFFHSHLYVESVSDTESPVIHVDVSPKAATIRDYIHEKIIHDSADPGFASMISGDTYPVEYSESGTEIGVKIRRIASKFESYSDSQKSDVTGLGIASLAPEYLGNSKDARLEIPLGVGLGALSPISVNVAVGNVGRNYSYDYIDFGADKKILINLSRNNTLKISKSPGSITVEPPHNFGEITRLYVDGHAINTTCNARCVIGMADGNSHSITVENFWGGQAHGMVPEFAVEKTPSASSNVLALGLFVLSLPVTYWIYRNVKNYG